MLQRSAKYVRGRAASVTRFLTVRTSCPPQRTSRVDPRCEEVEVTDWDSGRSDSRSTSAVRSSYFRSESKTTQGSGATCRSPASAFRSPASTSSMGSGDPPSPRRGGGTRSGSNPFAEVGWLGGRILPEPWVSPLSSGDNEDDSRHTLSGERVRERPTDGLWCLDQPGPGSKTSMDSLTFKGLRCTDAKGRVHRCEALNVDALAMKRRIITFLDSDHIAVSGSRSNGRRLEMLVYRRSSPGVLDQILLLTS